MSDPLRILILEDNPADAELIQFELREEGICFTSKLVMTEGDFLRELREFSPNLILSDYDLPQYNGSLAFAAAKSQCPDVPFLLVTGAISEDRAIEMLTKGAKDYVMKNRLNRLVPAVLRALAEAKEHKERQKAVEALHAAYLYSRTLIETSLDPLVTISSDGKVMDVNKATEEITGVPREQIIGNDFSDYFTEPAKARRGYERVFSKGSVKDYPLAIRHISGRVTKVLYNAATYKNEKGEVQGVFAAARDVTKLSRTEEKLRKARISLESRVKKRTESLQAEVSERRRTEEALLLSEQNYRLLHDTMLQGVVYQNTEGKVISMNPAAVRILGKSPEEFTGHTSESDAEHRAFLSNGSVLSGLDHPSMVALRTGQELRDVVMSVYNPQEKVYRWLNVRAKPLFRPGEDKPYQVYIIFDDITERRLEEKRLEGSERMYRAIGESIDYGVWVCAPDGRNIYASESFLRLVGQTQEECSNFGWGDVLHPDDAAGTIAAWKDCVRTGCMWDMEHRYRGVDGEWHPILARGLPVRDEQGEVVYWAGINLDISKLKQAEMNLKERTLQLEYANKELDSFSYSVSHDLRSPLRAIEGYSRMILDQAGEGFNEKTRSLFNVILVNTQRMGQLIEDLLSLSRMGKGTLSPAKVNVEVLARDAWRELNAGKPDSPVDLKIDPLPPVLGDRSLIRQVLVNLLSNAIKFTRARQTPVIEVGGYNTGKESVCYVRDNGVGFDMKYYEKLFGVFQRLHSAREYEGAGVGLAIVERIVHRHGGRVWAESEPDKGATFYFSLPAQEK